MGKRGARIRPNRAHLPLAVTVQAHFVGGIVKPKERRLVNMPILRVRCQGCDEEMEEVDGSYSSPYDATESRVFECMVCRCKVLIEVDNDRVFSSPELPDEDFLD